MLSPVGVGVDGDDSDKPVRPARRALSGPLGFDRKIGKDHMLPQEDASSDGGGIALAFVLCLVRLEKEDEALGTIGCDTTSFLLD
jgi:hypothetical protein